MNSNTSSLDQKAKTLTGYLHPDYAKSLAEFGILRELSRSGSWILVRQIPGLPYHDAMGCYPLFCCQDWSKLHLDLEEIGTDLVSLSLVADPFGDYDEAYLRQCFDLVIAFKEHFVTDLRRPLSEIASKNRRKKARRALKKIQIDVYHEPKFLLDTWIDLYKVLVKKHNIQGIRRFSRAAFAKQLDLPGAVMLCAVYHNTTIGVLWNFVQGDTVYGHLAAFSKLGYHLGASHALDRYSIDYFGNKARWIDLGGGAGIGGDDEDSLSQYKRGWSTGTRTAYFCGRIFDHDKYAEIVKSRGISETNYFPAYRRGEFG